ncbi:MAG: hypothetical protein LBR11_03025 [Deltaproteobacteria bacterium]|jgi:ATP-dependent DNA helicase RecG|nr:hypothetical protein [Deltaproteobacteria bacterium]
MRLETSWLYPFEAVREIVVNALVHRDLTRSVDIEVSLYSDRLEVISPGRLHNSITIEQIIEGIRYPRNLHIVDILRDYDYLEPRGMWIRNKVSPLMLKYNNINHIFNQNENSFVAILPKK